ncbi:hypothetical protein E2C01_076300 [Portunus trituberculatus]|uniref:Uncharacterized protein n=1 Tax=Portunus trituberculatus TaxID=210409 RepID=A0A5B7I8E3_PORTR|nr:hypothetical protein [Portunus trituberculatus]
MTRLHNDCFLVPTWYTTTYESTYISAELVLYSASHKCAWYTTTYESKECPVQSVPSFLSASTSILNPPSQLNLSRCALLSIARCQHITWLYSMLNPPTQHRRCLLPFLLHYVCSSGL